MVGVQAAEGAGAPLWQGLVRSRSGVFRSATAASPLTAAGSGALESAAFQSRRELPQATADSRIIPRYIHRLGAIFAQEMQGHGLPVIDSSNFQSPSRTRRRSTAPHPRRGCACDHTVPR